MDWEQLFDKIKTKKNFIYYIENNYYVIGVGVFRLCTAEEIEMYKTYKKELYVLNLPYSLNKNDLKNLHSAINSILISVYEPLGSLSNPKLKCFLSNLTMDKILQLDCLVDEWLYALNICESPHHKK